MEIFGLGVFLTGASGIGKSEIALSLIGRGHRLIADDAVRFEYQNKMLIGQCPATLKDFLEIRGLGILNIRAMFGNNALNDATSLNLIVHLIDITDETVRSSNRLYGMYSSEKILTVSVPKVTIPVGPGRHLSPLVETAVQNHRLRLSGYDASADFIKRQNQLLQIEEETHS